MNGLILSIDGTTQDEKYAVIDHAAKEMDCQVTSTSSADLASLDAAHVLLLVVWLPRGKRIIPEVVLAFVNKQQGNRLPVLIMTADETRSAVQSLYEGHVFVCGRQTSDQEISSVVHQILLQQPTELEVHSPFGVGATVGEEITIDQSYPGCVGSCRRGSSLNHTWPWIEPRDGQTVFC